MHALYFLSVWVHIVAASVWIGSMAFFALVVAPVLRRAENRDALGPMVRSLGLRFRVLGWACLAVLIVTGATNLWLRGVGLGLLAEGAFWRTEFGRALAYKLALVVAVVVSTVAHEALFTRSALRHLGAAPTSPAALRRRAVASWLGRATLLLSLAVVLFAVALVRGLPW